MYERYVSMCVFLYLLLLQHEIELALRIKTLGEVLNVCVRVSNMSSNQRAERVGCMSPDATSAFFMSAEVHDFPHRPPLNLGMLSVGCDPADVIQMPCVMELTACGNICLKGFFVEDRMGNMQK